jgi:hypothetical protein
MFGRATKKSGDVEAKRPCNGRRGDAKKASNASPQKSSGDLGPLGGFWESTRERDRCVHAE